MILVIILYALCASMFTVSKFALYYSQPIFFVGLRMVLAGILLGLYYIIRNGPHLVKITKLDQFLLLQVVLFHIYLTYICDLCALKEISSIESAFIYNLSPFITAIFSYLYFSEKMTFKKWIGLTIGFASFLPELSALHYSNLLSSVFWKPRILTFIAVISSAYGWVVLRKLVKDRGYSPIFVNSFGMFFGGILAFITSYLTESWLPSPVTQWVPFLSATALIIVIANLFFYNLYGYLLERYTATFLSFAGFICPLLAAILGNIFLHEPIPARLIFSFIFVLIGLYIFYQEELRQGYINYN